MLNNIPIIREGIIDSCLLVLHDYAHYVTCAPEEIDAERGVILEERRSRRDANWRTFERLLPFYFGDTQMARRTLIGGEEQLKTFKYESLTNFYRKWYNPDMQAVIVVGDFDVDMMEQKIKETFSSIPAPEVPTVKPVIPIPGNEEPAVAIITDPEATSSSIQLIWKGDAMPKEYASTDVAFMTDIIKMIIGDAFAERMEAITASSTAPFMSGSLGISQLVEGTDAVMSEVSFKDGDYKKALEAFYTEIERIKRYGITESELERAKMELISSAERGVEAAPTRKSPQLVYPILNHFFHNNYMLEPEVELQLTQAICAQLPAMVFQQIIDQMITEENMLIAYTAPEREGLVHPTEAELLAVIESVKASEIAAPVEEGANEPLLDADAIKAGKIKKEKAAAYGATEWTLSNGVKVVYLPTAHKADEVQVRVVMNGGRSLIETAELPSFDDNVWALYSQNRGLSKFSGVQLKKLLTGKNVRCELNIEKTRHNINIVSTPKDLETAMQLLYLNVTAPRFDNEEFLIGINQIKAVLPNLEKMPQLKLQKLIMETLYGNHERVITINSEVVEKANINDFEKASRRLFSNVAGATVYVVGNVDAETLKPLVAKYIASLPGGKKGSKFIDRSEDIVKGNVVKNEAMVMETPKSTVLQVYTAYMPYSIKNEVLLDIAKLYLDMVYVETLRESEGGTYGASVATICSREPKDVAIMQVAFETNPESAEKLSNLAVEGVKKLVAEGIPADKFDMIIKNIKKNIPQDRISNRYWGSVLQKSVEFGDKYDSEYEEAVDTATPEAVVKAVKELLADDNFIQLVVSPEK
jgi:zinc protease